MLAKYFPQEKVKDIPELPRIKMLFLIGVYVAKPIPITVVR
ncbi:Uncharacterized protein YR821_1837 [Yersinia ruckeri]|uniref:Uncharacterized protein n=1 Tax=Yersinia ruckeri TaxID=29486 RepID=A0A0A8VH11_YERRU|nr:hypothetical protein yruck0001_13620 [Yersinia ruckeri ATCC 29473]QTD76758.1 Uncharacterized protein YR821_1837 [Yersinia ruckeri]CEK27658.1 hypothetical protein CSF007_9525 [Yersinia ruckeri]